MPSTAPASCRRRRATPAASPAAASKPCASQPLRHRLRLALRARRRSRRGRPGAADEAVMPGAAAKPCGRVMRRRLRSRCGMGRVEPVGERGEAWRIRGRGASVVVRPRLHAPLRRAIDPAAAQAGARARRRHPSRCRRRHAAPARGGNAQLRAGGVEDARRRLGRAVFARAELEAEQRAQADRARRSALPLLSAASGTRAARRCSALDASAIVLDLGCARRRTPRRRRRPAPGRRRCRAARVRA